VSVKQIRVEVTDVHLRKLDEAKKILGCKSRSELMRHLILNSVKYAEDYLRQSGIKSDSMKYPPGGYSALAKQLKRSRDEG